MAPLPVDPSGGDGRGCAKNCAGGTPALPGGHRPYIKPGTSFTSCPGIGQGALCRPQDHSPLEGESARGRSPQSSRRGAKRGVPGVNVSESSGAAKRRQRLAVGVSPWDGFSISVEPRRRRQHVPEPEARRYGMAVGIGTRASVRHPVRAQPLTGPPRLLAMQSIT